jgi:hypothetical protein
MKILYTVIGCVLALALLSSVASSCAAQRQAQATIAVANASQAQSTAIMVLVGILALVIIGAALTIGLLSFRVNRMQQQLAGNQAGWLPGGGQKINGQYLPGGGKYNGQPQGDPNQALMTMMMMQMLQQQQSQQHQLPASVDDNTWRW